MQSLTSRRSILKKMTLVGSATGLIQSPAIVLGKPKTYKAAVIGRTGGGDYGHGLDTIFNGFDHVEVVAVADAHPQGLKKAAERSGAKRTYSDYHEMLDREKPDLVSIAPRQPDCHRDMALAAIQVGAHLYMEKPITEYPRDADDILNAANKKQLKIGVAHTKRYMDHFLAMKQLLHDGYLGDILEVRFQGKQDRRVGGEDLIVLGSHDMDMMRFLYGDPQWCFASITTGGHEITKEDIHKGREPYTIAGDTIHADYTFTHNLQCRWSSVKGTDPWNESYRLHDKTINKWGFDIFGSKRILSHQESVGTYIFDCPFIAPNDSRVKWRPIEEIITVSKPPQLTHPIRNLLYAIEHDTQPQCSGEDARWAVEMCCAPYRSQKTHARVSFPLKYRDHPLSDF